MQKDPQKNNSFNKQNIYRTQLKPLLKQLLLICSDNDIPIYIDIAVANTDKTTKYETEFLSAGSYGYRLAKDNLVKYALIRNGFSVYPGHNRPYLEEALPQYLSTLDEDSIHDVTQDQDGKVEAAESDNTSEFAK